MPGTPTTKYNIPTLAGADLVKNGPIAINAALAAIDPLLAPSDQGALASRPVSTPGSPGKIGRTYKATDTGQHFRDHGTGWDQINLPLDAAVTTAKLADGAVTDAKLASPSNAAWRTIYTAVGALKGSDPGGKNILAGGMVRPVGGSVLGQPDPAIFGFDPADYAISGKTLQLRLKVAGATNSTSAGGNVALDMAPITSASGAVDTLAIGVGTAVVSVVVTPPTSSAFGGAGAAVTAPAAGVYALCFNTAAAIAANSAVLMHAFVQARYI